MNTNRKIPTQYEIRTIAEHAMRRLFQASGRSWEEYGPEDAQRAEWIENALVIEADAADGLNAERTDWSVPKPTTLRPVAATPSKIAAPRSSLTPRVLADQLVEETA